jgi:fructose-specific phosphotransferase system IIC component
VDVGQLGVQFGLATSSSDRAFIGATRHELLLALELTTVIAGLLSGLIMLFLGRTACRRHHRSFVTILVLTFICALSLAVFYVFRLRPLLAYWW